MAHERKYLTEFGAYNPRAILGEIRRELADKQEFLSRWSGEPRKYWEAQIKWQVTTRILADARYERSSFVVDRITVLYTPAERARITELSWANPLTAELPRTRAYRDARIELEELGRAAWKRAEAEVLAKIKSDSKLANYSRLTLQPVETAA